MRTTNISRGNATKKRKEAALSRLVIIEEGGVPSNCTRDLEMLAVQCTRDVSVAMLTRALAACRLLIARRESSG